MQLFVVISQWRSQAGTLRLLMQVAQLARLDRSHLISSNSLQLLFKTLIYGALQPCKIYIYTHTHSLLNSRKLIASSCSYKLPPLAYKAVLALGLLSYFPN